MREIRSPNGSEMVGYISRVLVGLLLVTFHYSAFVYPELDRAPEAFGVHTNLSFPARRGMTLRHQR